MSDPSSDTYVSKAPAILVTVVLECVFPIAHCRRCMNMFEHAVAVTVTVIAPPALALPTLGPHLETEPETESELET